MVRLVQLSDIHFGGEDTAALAAATAYVQASPPDLTLVTGDLTLNGLPAEFRAASAWVKQLPMPRLCTPGNHDTPYWNLVLRALTPFERYRRHLGRIRNQSCHGAGFAARMINTARGAQPRLDWSKGAIGLDAAERAVADLGTAPQGALRLVGCHHPLVEVKGAPVSGAVHRGAEAATMLAEGGVDLILTGHIHNPFAIALPYGDGHTYAVGAGTLSVRTRGVPPSFNLIEADDCSVEITAMAWTGKALEVFQTWRLPRRGAA
jgi:3',5'-cyclic AMP phosphodiesterase CpdA